jgi:hypothetical protein
MKQSTDKRRKEQLDQLRALDHAAGKLRQKLGVSSPGEIIWRATTLETEFLAVADGYGSAKVLETEGNYPIKYFIVREQGCATEAEGSRLAEEWFVANKEPRL